MRKMVITERQYFEEEQLRREQHRRKVQLTQEQRREYESLQTEAATAASIIEDVRFK